MNVFAVDYDPELAAMSLCDQHVVKMVTETAQILSTHIRLCDQYLSKEHDSILYKSTHVNHPITKHLRNGHGIGSFNQGNLRWLIIHYMALSNEYTYRYGKLHAAYHSQNRGDIIYDFIKQFDPDLKTTWDWYHENFKTYLRGFPLCMPDQYKPKLDRPLTQKERVLAYRKYYIGEKLQFARWNIRRPPPSWIDNPEEDL